MAQPLAAPHPLVDRLDGRGAPTVQIFSQRESRSCPNIAPWHYFMKLIIRNSKHRFRESSERGVHSVHFNEHFSVSAIAMRTLGVFNPEIGIDNKMFVDPKLLEDAKYPRNSLGLSRRKLPVRSSCFSGFLLRLGSFLQCSPTLDLRPANAFARL